MAVLVLTGNACMAGGEDAVLSKCDSSTHLSAGDTLEVRLESQVTTGYLWHIASQTTGILHAVGEPETEWAEDRPDVDGGSEVQVFRFEAPGVGEDVVIFHNAHPWAKDGPPRKTCTISVTVTDPAP